MFGNSDMPHAVPGPSPANNPSTTPDESAGYQEGFADAQAGQHPTYADRSSSVSPNVSQYAQGYSAGVAANGGGTGINPDIPSSLGQGGNVPQTHSDISPLSGTAKISDRFVKSASRDNADFAKGYGFASHWEAGKPLVTLGSAEFESGVFAGLIDHPTHQEAWVQAHQRQGVRDKRFTRRITTYARYMDHLAAKGIVLEASDSCGCDGGNCKCSCKGKSCSCKGCTCHKSKTAATSTDLDTMDPSTSPSATGATPINGPGQPGPLAGQQDAAAPGGAAPQNGAPPFGTPVVPTGLPQSKPGSGYVNDIAGGPADGNVNQAAIAFRRKVQASLLETNRRN
jgi:hypothetical protein